MKNNNKRNLIVNSVLSIAALLVASHFPSIEGSAYAKTSVTDKVKNDVDDTTTGAKKKVRKHKKKLRDKTGNGSLIEDGKDAVNNVGDDISNAGKKAKRAND